MGRLRVLRMPSPAMVVACIALAVALSGASYAAIVLPRNSVGTPQLKKNAVTSAKVKNNAITGAKVNEATLGQVPSAANADNAANAANAQNADKLDNIDSTGFYAAGSKVADADKIDGVDSASLVRGGGQVQQYAEFVGADSESGRLLIDGGALGVFYFCPEDPVLVEGRAIFRNNTTAEVRLFIDSGGSDPGHVVLTSSGESVEHFQFTNSTGDFITYQARRADGTITTAWLSSIHESDGSGCHFQVEAVTAKP